VQPNEDEADPELLALAAMTERVAAAIGDAAIKDRLQMIAGEVRAMALRGRDLLGDPDRSGAGRPPA
jgi:hypothetical protein